MGLRAGLFFGAWMTLFYVLFMSNPWWTGFIPGILSGVLFGAITAWMARRQAKKLLLERPTFTGETLIFEGPANHFVGREAVGGYLFLTDARLLFRSHRVNIQNHELAIPLGEMSSVEATKTLRVVANGLSITLGSGQQEKFVVNEHTVWRDKIEVARKGAAAANPSGIP